MFDEFGYPYDDVDPDYHTTDELVDGNTATPESEGLTIADFDNLIEWNDELQEANELLESEVESLFDDLSAAFRVILSFGR